MDSEKIRTIKISGHQARQRIDKFLADFYSEKSRAEWQRKIKNGEILVNDKIIKADYILRENDEVKIFKISPYPLSLLAKEGNDKIPLTPFNKKGNKKSPPTSSFVRRGVNIKIIYEDDEVIVLDKPAGVLVHPVKHISKNPPNLLLQRGNSQEGNNYFTLVDFLLEHYPKMKNVGENKSRPGIVHRLDKDTSGIIIAAKNNRSFDFLKKQFQERKTEKEYRALVYGKVRIKKGMINLAIARSKNKFDRQTVIDTVKKENLKSRSAITFYEVIKYFKNYTLLKAAPKTGRMHQIRVHLKAIGHPIVGDPKYKFRKLPAVSLKRQFLHAVKLKITLPNGKMKVFKSELAGDLKEFLEKLE